jgi:large subunit ribosomal protein L17
MRHGVKLNRLGRTSSHRKALMSNMASQLIQYKRIITTLAKAKALRTYVEPLLTKSKTDDTHNRRLVFAKLQNKEAIIELFSTISEKIASRPGGYTRIIKMEPRAGDAAEMAMIELVDFNLIYNNNNNEAASDKKKTRRSRTAAPKTDAPKAAKAPKAEVVVEEVAAPVVEEVTATVVEEVTATVVEEVAAPVVEEVAAPVVEEVAAPVVEEVAADTKVDDLKIVEGIGPKIADLFIAKGITTFKQLSETSVETMQAILDEAGPAYKVHNPETWAKQSEMADQGKWDELKAWQDELNAGKTE